VLPAFVLWGAGSMGRGSRSEISYAGVIFGQKIPYSVYRDARQATRNQAIMQFGDNFSELEKKVDIEAQAWNRLILLAETKKRKIKVSDKETVTLIQKYLFFQKKGKFDNSIYLQMLQYVFRTPPRTFEEETRENIALSKLYDTVTQSVELNDKELRQEYKKENEQVSLYYLAALNSDFTKDAAVDEKELKSYFEKNSLEFKQPISFNIEYVGIDAASDENAARDKADKIFLRLRRRENLKKIAQDFGLEAKETGLFGQTDPIPGIGWSMELLNEISKLKAGQFLSPVYMDKTYYLLRVKEIKNAYVPDFEKIKDKVKDVFSRNKAQDLAKEKAENCMQKLNELYKIDPKTIDFETIAKEYGLKYGSTELFKYGSYIEGIGASDEFWMASQSLTPEGNFIMITGMPAGFYIIKLKARLPIDEKKISEEKNEFSAQLLLQKKQEHFAAFLEELKRKSQRF